MPHISNVFILIRTEMTFSLKVTPPSFFAGVPSYFEALWYPHLSFYRKSNTYNG